MTIQLFTRLTITITMILLLATDSWAEGNSIIVDLIRGYQKRANRSPEEIQQDIKKERELAPKVLEAKLCSFENRMGMKDMEHVIVKEGDSYFYFTVRKDFNTYPAKRFDEILRWYGTGNGLVIDNNKGSLKLPDGTLLKYPPVSNNGSCVLHKDHKPLRPFVTPPEKEEISR